VCVFGSIDAPDFLTFSKSVRGVVVPLTPARLVSTMMMTVCEELSTASGE